MQQDPSAPMPVGPPHVLDVVALIWHHRADQRINGALEVLINEGDTGDEAIERCRVASETARDDLGASIAALIRTMGKPARERVLAYAAAFDELSPDLPGAGVPHRHDRTDSKHLPLEAGPF
jgi:hypothetical protein